MNLGHELASFAQSRAIACTHSEICCCVQTSNRSPKGHVRS